MTKSNAALNENYPYHESRPIIPKGSHPIETGNYHIPTNEILNLYTEVSKWILNRSPGGIIYGRPRLGKTRSVKFLQAFLQDEFGDNLPVFHMCCNQYKSPNENTFFGDLLKDLGHTLYLSGKADVKRDRTVKYLLERAEASAQHRIILFIDDAQRLFELNYAWLMDIYNQLDRYNVGMTVILVGQEELVHQRSAFIQAGKMQIISRFMIHEYKFSGIKNVEDLAACLEGYDFVSEYPENSGWSFTRYYFPEAFAEGKRLSSCAEELFEQFVKLRNEAKITKSIEIPMQYITLTIDYCLRIFGSDGSDLEFPCAAQWKAGIMNSGYIQAELYQNMKRSII